MGGDGLCYPVTFYHPLSFNFFGRLLLEVTKSRTGEWEWEMENEEWEMENEEWEMENEEWGMENEEWGMENEEWGMGNGE